MFFPRELPRLLFYVDDAYIFEYSYDTKCNSCDFFLSFFFFFFF